MLVREPIRMTVSTLIRLLKCSLRFGSAAAAARLGTRRGPRLETRRKCSLRAYFNATSSYVSIFV